MTFILQNIAVGLFLFEHYKLDSVSVVSSALECDWQLSHQPRQIKLKVTHSVPWWRNDNIEITLNNCKMFTTINLKIVLFNDMVYRHTINFPWWSKQTCQMCENDRPLFVFSLKHECSPNLLWPGSKSLVRHRSGVMIWDVISAEQESKQRRYLQKVSHMLNQWQGMGGRTAASPTAIWQHTHAGYTHMSARAHSVLTAAGIIDYSLCVC